MTCVTLTGHISFSFFIETYVEHLKIGGMPSVFGQAESWQALGS